MFDKEKLLSVFDQTVEGRHRPGPHAAAAGSSVAVGAAAGPRPRLDAQCSTALRTLATPRDAIDPACSPAELPTPTADSRCGLLAAAIWPLLAAAGARAVGRLPAAAAAAAVRAAAAAGRWPRRWSSAGAAARCAVDGVWRRDASCSTPSPAVAVVGRRAADHAAQPGPRGPVVRPGRAQHLRAVPAAGRPVPDGGDDHRLRRGHRRHVPVRHHARPAGRARPTPTPRSREPLLATVAGLRAAGRAALRPRSGPTARRRSTPLLATALDRASQAPQRRSRRPATESSADAGRSSDQAETLLNRRSTGCSPGRAGRCAPEQQSTSAGRTTDARRRTSLRAGHVRTLHEPRATPERRC